MPAKLTTNRWALVLSLLAVAPRPIAPAEDATASPVFFAISVPDLDASVAWYEKYLDMKTRRLPGTEQARVAILESDRLMVEIIEHANAFDLQSRVPEGERRYLVHGVFKVGMFVSDLDETVARLERDGARFRGGVMDDVANGVRTALLLDNNDNIIQLFERIE